MAVTREELGQRIAEVRRRRGISQAQLGEGVDLTQSAISRIETGERSVDSIELARLGEMLRVSVLDLLDVGGAPEEELLGLSELRVSARGQEVRQPAAVNAALARVQGLLRFDRLLDQLGAPRQVQGLVPPFTWPLGLTPKEEGKWLAHCLRDRLDLKDNPIQELAELIEANLGLDIALEPLLDGLSGLCVHAASGSVALVDSSPVVGRQRFTMAHEVCHHLAGDPEPVHIDEQLFSRTTRETRANSFAAYLLMPETGIGRYVKGRPVDGRVVVELQYAFGVSLDALCWHLVNLRLISETKRRSFLDLGPKSLAYQHGYYSQWQASERLRGLVQPPLRLLRRGLAGYAEGYIGIGRLADLLKLDDAEAFRRELEDVGIAPHRWTHDTADE